MLDQIRGCGGELAADREALNHAGDQQDGGCGDADCRVGRGEGKQGHAQSHRSDHGGKHVLPADHIGEMPEHDAAQGAQHIGNAKDGECGQKGGWRSRREEYQRDRDRQEAVDREIIPFKGVADDRRDDLRLHGDRGRMCSGGSLSYRHGIT